QEELVPECKGFLLVPVVEIDRDVVEKSALSHVLGEAATFEGSVLERTAGGDDLGAIHPVRVGIVFALRRDFAPQHGEASGVAVVEYLDDLGALVALTKVALVNYERSPECVEHSKEW